MGHNANTTDNQEEVYDVVNEQDEVIGKATRREVHSNKRLIHRTVGAHIFNRQKQILMQKRSKTKDMYPGYWVFSVGGHVDSGDTYERAVLREIREELGVEGVSVVPVSKMLQAQDGETEFWVTFMGIHDGPFLKFNTTEIEELRFFDISDFIEQGISGELLVPPSTMSMLPAARELVESGRVDELIKSLE